MAEPLLRSQVAVLPSEIHVELTVLLIVPPVCVSQPGPLAPTMRLLPASLTFAKRPPDMFRRPKPLPRPNATQLLTVTTAVPLILFVPNVVALPPSGTRY